MRLATVSLGLFLFIGSVAVAHAVDISVERLADEKVYICPRCQKPIRADHVAENAELLLSDALKANLGARRIPVTEGKGKDVSRLSIFVYRFQERKGSNIAVDKPASVGFHAHLYRRDTLIKTAVFDETQEPLSENVFKLGTFLRRGAKWITVEELCREGMERAVDQLQNDLEASK
jgi:hypothetical protein